MRRNIETTCCICKSENVEMRVEIKDRESGRFFFLCKDCGWAVEERIERMIDELEETAFADAQTRDMEAR